jgi:LTXXQ motif family protein
MMRRGMLLLLLAPLMALPTSVGAYSLPIPGVVAVPLSMAASGFGGRRAAHRTRQHRKAAHVRRHRHVAERPTRPRRAETTGVGMPANQGIAPEPSGNAQATATPQDGVAPRSEPSAWAGSQYWPSAADDLFAYALRPAGTGQRFWSHSARDLAEAIFLGPDAKASSGQACDPRSDDGGWRDALTQAVQPTDAQRAAFEEVQSALAGARKDIDRACPTAGAAATPTGRLDAMTDRIWAMRQGSIVVRAPVKNFITTLTDEQRSRLAEGGAEASAACADPASAMVAWPSEEIERHVRPTDAQRESLQALQMTIQGMGQFLMASCPKEPPATPLQRLGAAEKRLNALLYAARVTSPALHGFYDSLSPEQKAAFDSLKAQPLPPGAPAMAHGMR